MTTSEIKQEALDQQTLIITTGAVIDNTNVRQIASILSESRVAGYKTVVLDMTNLEFLSSAGVGAIFSHVQKYRDAGGDLILCSISEPIEYVLKELDVAEHLTIVVDRNSACLTAGVPE